MRKKKTDKTEDELIQMSVDLKLDEIEACVLGTTPYICNRLSQKAWHQLLFPSGRKSEAERNLTLKHDPLEEYRASPYVNPSDSAATLLEVPAVAFKRGVESVALDVPGTTKARILRNVVAPDRRIPLYGVPQMFMAIVRDANGTPDVRTRAIVPEWATRVRIRYPHPILQKKAMGDYLALSGQLRGVGDYRAEKGAGSYGLFEIVDPDDPRYLAVMQFGGRKAQLAAIESPEFHDDETREMFEWFVDERERRGRSPTVSKVNGKANGRLVEIEDEEARP